MNISLVSLSFFSWTTAVVRHVRNNGKLAEFRMAILSEECGPYFRQPPLSFPTQIRLSVVRPKGHPVTELRMPLVSQVKRKNKPGSFQ